MKKEYPITDEKFNQAVRLINENGGKIYNDGTFKIKGISGKYTETNYGTMVIEITDKPWLASWGMIESKLDEFFG